MVDAVEEESACPPQERLSDEGGSRSATVSIIPWFDNCHQTEIRHR